MSDKKKTWERRMEDAKKKHRPKLKNWEKDGYCLERLNDFKVLAGDSVVDNVVDISKSSGDRRSSGSSSSSRRDRFHDDNHRSRVSNHSVTNRSDSSSNDDNCENRNGKPLYQLDRISCTKITPSEFIKSYEKECLPCIITDIPREEKWPAWNSWNFDSVHSNLERENGGKKSLQSLMESYFKVGEDDDGYKVKVRLRYFLKYLELNKDDSPLYVFDSNFDSNEETKRIVTDYSVPSFFPDDLFSLVGEKRRPPYRWFLVGPERSGTCVHIDPLGTSAWNTVLQGRKRWVLFPPNTPKSIAKGLDVILKGEDDEAINYFTDMLPRIKAKHGSTYPIIEFTQGPGDTVFVPGGWWHGVLNIDSTIAITQNFCSRTNFDRVWVKARDGRKKMSVKLLRKLRSEYPEVAKRAEELNKRDGFVMYKRVDKDSSDKDNDKKRKRDKEISCLKDSGKTKGSPLDKTETESNESEKENKKSKKIAKQ